MLSNSSKYFYEQFDLLDNIEYLDEDFAHNFIRNFYYTDIVNTIRVNKESVNANKIKFNTKDGRIYSKVLNKTTDYFTVATSKGIKLFVKTNETEDTVFYERSTTLGIPHGLKEINIYNSEGKKLDNSVLQINKAEKNNKKPGIAKVHEVRILEILKDDENAKKRCIKIR